MKESKQRSEERRVALPGYVQTVRLLWYGRKYIAVATAVCIAVSIIAALVLPKEFESSVSLILLPTPIKQSEEMNELSPEVLTVSDYQILLNSEGTLIQAVDRVEQLGTWQEEDLAELRKISKLRRRMYLGVEVVEKTAYGTTYSPVMVLRARARTPELARDLAQAWASLSEELSRSMYSKGKIGLKDFVENKFNTAQTELLDTVGKIRDVEIEFDNELEDARMLANHERLLSYEDGLAEVEIDMAVCSTEVESIRADFEKESEKKTLWKSPPMTAVFVREVMDEALGEGPRTGAGSGGIPEPMRLAGYSEEVFNGAYQDLKERLLLKQTELATLVKRKEMLVEAKKVVEEEGQELRELIARRDYERKELDYRSLPLKESYDLLAEKLELAKIVESEEEDIGDIEIVADAVLPDKKIKPARTLIVVMSTLAGFAVACGAVLLRDILSRIA